MHILDRFGENGHDENPLVGVKHQALSESIVDKIIKIASTSEFLPEKGGSYLRAATSDPCNGDRVPSFPPTKEYEGWDKMCPIMRIGQREDGSARLSFDWGNRQMRG